MKMPAHWKACRQAFTLIELLVVLSIIGLLLAILLPAVQASRSAASRARCENNLRQFGIALNAYSALFGVYPQGINGNRYSLHAMLLPQLDQGPLFHSINFNIPSNESDEMGGANLTVAWTRPSMFLCPVDRADFDLISQFGGLKRTSYAGNGGYGGGYDIGNGHFVPDNGLFGANSMTGSISSASLSDGLSQTAAMSEWSLGPWDHGGRDPRLATFVTEPLDTFDEFVSVCQNLNPKVAEVWPGKFGFWIRGGAINTILTHAIIPGGHTCINSSSVSLGAITAGSNHQSGANLLVADGHVSFIRNSISLQLWRAYSTRSGGEIVNQIAD